MARANYGQNGFTTGEVSKEFQARSDHERYGAALRRSRNGLILPQGPVQRRSGFRYVAETDDSSMESRLIPFQYNVSQTYALEFGDNYIKFFTQEAQLQDDNTGKNFTNGTFDTDLTGWTDLDAGAGASSQSSGTMLLAGGTGVEYAWREQQLISGLGLGTYTVTCDVAVDQIEYLVGTTSGASDIATGTLSVGSSQTFNFTTIDDSDVFVSFRNANASTSPTIDNIVLTLASSRAYKIYSPYTESDLYGIKYTQSNDVLYLFHPDYRPKQLNRLGASRWTITDYDFKDGPFENINTDASKTITTSAAGALGTAVTVTATGHTPFVSTDTGKLIRHKRGGQWRSIQITAYTSSTQVTGVFQDDNPTGYTAGASSDWRLGVWSEANGWPSNGVFFQQRLITANNALYPQSVWGSVTGIFDKYSPTEADGTVVDDNGLNYLIASGEGNNITWLVAGKVLSIGTIAGEFTLRSGSISNPEPLSPTNGSPTPETNVGSDASIKALKPAENTVIYVNRSGKKVYEYIYDFNIEGFASPELTVLARHITKSGIKDLTMADDVMWAGLNNGKLVSMTYLKAEKVVGWAQHPVGGSFNSGEPVVESLTSITAPDLSHKQLWAIIKRTIDSNTVRYVEFMEDLYDPDDNDDKPDAFFVDSGLTYSGVSTTTVTGLGHLEGEEVAVLADGAPLPNKTVSSGAISLGAFNAATKVQVGLPTYFLIETLDPDVGGNAGTAKGKTKRCDRVIPKFINTIGCQVGRDEDNLDDIIFREPDDLMGDSPDLYDGYKEVEFEDDFVLDLKITLKNSQPLPITVSEVLMDISVNGS